jgi:Zn-dependent M32 family carboxypeptidase
LALSFETLAFAELCSTRQSCPAWSSRETSDLSGLDPGDPFGLIQDVPWALSTIPYIPDYSHDTIIAIMELIGHLYRCIKSKLVRLP